MTKATQQFRKSNKKKKTKKQFFYNPRQPKLSYDIFNNNNSSDTIPIKYTTLEDVKNTIKNLEKLYKNKVYPHKRILQVAMIMKVRLQLLQKIKPEQYKLALNYFNFLKKRTTLNTKSRYAFHFLNTLYK